MISQEVRDQYTVTIGIECHVQLKTKTKLFSAVGNDAREAPPNTLISHIDLGMPGALPVLNEKALELATRAAFALSTEPERFSQFDRKHYFYPDLPMGYQITQFYNPIIRSGSVTFAVGQQTKTVRIHEAHLEADAGKSTHPAGKDYSLVDLNRAGTPLLEIVSEPDMHSALEAKQYAKELWLLMRYADVSDASLYYGNMRFDVNVSVSKTDELGTRTETKNLNSFRSVEKAIEYETERQIELLEKGQPIVQETRGWDEAKQKTVAMRSKEEAHDYRYMPEPDIPPIELTEDMIKPVRDSMPPMPGEWRTRLVGLGLDVSQTDTLLEAEVESEANYLAIIEASLSEPEKAKAIANWLVNIEIPLRRELETSGGLPADNAMRAKLYEEIYKLVSSDKLSSTKAKSLLTELLSKNKLPADLEAYAQDGGYLQVSDEGAIEKIVAAVLASNPAAAADVKNGEMKAIGFLVGQVMKESKGQANPQLAQQLIKKQLGL
ncbi:MAG: aspartyl-tRNA(Asn)/glutamyl-tRNA(Gln) amidotransferase subunit [Patescibacteria group bacterium]|nr:aspartyl-tRNA(Asn)/glutamyl-tRNA(Gln) amidotransferase subunit [Patescibacteria group bacterium]